jgi:RNA polymerase sigma-70 factor (ECF subfamily)
MQQESSAYGPSDARAPAASEHAPLVLAARGGDRFAFGQLYQLYHGMVHAVLLAHAPATDVDDLVQDVFMRALTQLKSLRDANAFGGWLAAIARNLARDRFRRTREQDELPEALPVREHQGDEAEAAVALAAIRRLPEAYRETLLMRLVEGLTGPEIAARTGLTHGTVRVNLHRGMKLLREQLEGSSG